MNLICIILLLVLELNLSIALIKYARNTPKANSFPKLLSIYDVNNYCSNFEEVVSAGLTDTAAFGKSLDKSPALVLNADYTPLSFM